MSRRSRACPRWRSARARSPGRRSRIDGDLVIGREGDLVIADPEISRRHCLIRIVDGTLVLDDLQSLNGTWVNGKRIELPTLLAPGDTIVLGTSAIEVVRPPDAAPRLRPRRMKTSFMRQLGLLARRSVKRTFRDPGSIAPALLVPLILFVLVSAGLEKATHVKGLPDAHDLDVHARDRVRERRDGRRRQHGPGHRDGHRGRLHQPARAHADEELRADRAPSSRGRSRSG